MENENWREQCKTVQAELEKIIIERDEWKEKWERLMQFKEAPRLPVRCHSTLDCVGTDKGATKGKTSTRVYENYLWGTEKSYEAQRLTTVGWVEGDDFK